MAQSSSIYLLRHGQTEWSMSGQHTGRTDIELTEVGEQQARHAGLTLSALRNTSAHPALVLSSPRIRARRTAALAGLTVDEYTEDLAEWDYGDYEGLTTPQIREKVPNWQVWNHPVPNGETVDVVANRAEKLLNRVKAALPAGDVVLIGHGHFSRVLVSTWIGYGAEAGQHFAHDPASITVIGYDREYQQILQLNVPPGD